MFGNMTHDEHGRGWSVRSAGLRRHQGRGGRKSFGGRSGRCEGRGRGRHDGTCHHCHERGHMAEFKHNNELRDHEVEVAHIEATTDSEIGSETCPLCRKHCLLSEPSCPKGEAYAARSL